MCDKLKKFDGQREDESLGDETKEIWLGNKKGLDKRVTIC